MGRFRLNPTRRAQGTISFGGAAAAVGVYLEFGTGWGLIAAGVIQVAFGLVLMDLDEDVKH